MKIKTSDLMRKYYLLLSSAVNINQKLLEKQFKNIVIEKQLKNIVIEKLI